MWGTSGAHLGYILSMYHAHFTYICMEIMLYFDPCALHCGASYTDTMNISWKYDLSSTWGKFSRLLKATLREATGRQRQPFLMHSFRHFSNKKVEIAVFCCGYQTRSTVEVAFTCLHLWHMNVNIVILARLVARLISRTYSLKNTNEQVRHYLSTSSLIARPVNGLLFLFGGLTDRFSYQTLVSLMDYSFAYNYFQKTRQLARGEGKITLSVDIRCIGISGKDGS